MILINSLRLMSRIHNLQILVYRSPYFKAAALGSCVFRGFTHMKDDVKQRDFTHLSTSAKTEGSQGKSLQFPPCDGEMGRREIEEEI
ncbi:hypothetical protein PFISCL1PPCAC_901 [Pristionchus fissidentatus]|uniref:Uncharacterized protein n=1 Tax=Pristionchus fissidentatus TaxID=1538716 RepID=A0AAV5UR64_9BILA|nr:hypothetical protein PFISCL1PPCAC_901 [Pristionchus fissidentatus]